MIFPAILQGQIATQAANIIGSPTDFRGLQNRTDKRLRIDEIRFQIVRADRVGVGRLTPTADGAFTSRIQLRIGNTPITADLVPVPSMTWPIDHFIEDANGLTGFTSVQQGYYLRFSKPVHIEPGEAIMVRWLHTATTAQRLTVTAICREANPADGQGFIPWITKWIPTVHTDGTGNFIDESTPADLVNPFDDTILVERLIGRLWWGSMASGNLREIGKENPPAIDQQPILPFDTFRVKAEDHEGTQIVRDATPFGVVFEFIRKSWAVNATLAPKGFYRVTLEARLATQVVDGTPQPITPFIGMLGYRAR